MDDSAQVPLPSIPNEEPSSPLPLPTSPNPKIELPDVPVIPGEPSIDETNEIPIVELPDQPVNPPESPEPKTEDPFLVPPQPMPQNDQKIPEEERVEVSSSLPPLPPTEENIKRTPMKSIALGILAVFVLAGGALGYFFFQKGGMEVTKKATDESSYDGKLVCMPIDDQGNITNEKYRYNRMIVINRTGQDVPVWIQDNFCEYSGSSPSSGYTCNNYHARWNDTVGNNSSKIFTMDVPCHKVGQLDIARDNSTGPACYNTIDNREWQGGTAFTIKANTTACPTCESNDQYRIKSYVSSSSVSPGEAIAFSFTSNFAFINIKLDTGSGATCVPEVIGCGTSDGKEKTIIPKSERLANCWTWRCTASTTSGNYQAKFSGSTSSDSSVNQICGAQIPFSVSTVAPPAACTNLTITLNEAESLENLMPKDTISFTTSFSGGVEDVAVDIRKNGVSVRSFLAGGPKTNSWTTPIYTIGEAGSYEVMGFIKVNGVWQ